jgi:hypothetical protein
MSAASAGAFAAGVSRALRAQGIRPLPSGTPRGREGVRVGKGGLDGTALVSVVIWDSPGHEARLAAAVDEALAATGYTVHRVDDTMWRVSR